jgi:hypothetical protein
MSQPLRAPGTDIDPCQAHEGERRPGPFAYSPGTYGTLGSRVRLVTMTSECLRAGAAHG